MKKATHLSTAITILLLVTAIGFGCGDERTVESTEGNVHDDTGESEDDDAGGSAAEEARSDIASTSLDQADEEGRVIVLPAPRIPGSVSLEETIAGRRSVREFTAEPLSATELGQLLWAMQGITSAQGARAAPSAGGTYPLEIYVVAGAVTDVPPAVYRYRPTHHDLTLIVDSDVRASLCAASLDQQWVSEAPIDIVVAAVYERTTERYGERGVRYVHLEAGHAAQNLCLQAVGLGLGAVTVGAFHDDEVKAILHLPPEEEPLYVIPVGRPASP